MTGAAMPRGANSIVMNEHARIEGEYVVLDEAAREGAHFVLEGQETRVGESVIARGKRLSLCRAGDCGAGGALEAGGGEEAARGDSFHGR